MAQAPGKFSIDRNLVRWTLLNGIITRKTLQDPPTGGSELPVSQVTALEKTTVKKVHRVPLARPAILAGVLMLALSWWSGALALRLVGALLGLLLLYWGATRLPAKTTEVESYRIVALGLKSDEWIVVGIAPETAGFIEAVKEELVKRSEAMEA